MEYRRSRAGPVSLAIFLSLRCDVQIEIGISSLSCLARLILAILLSLRCIVQIEIRTLFPLESNILGQGREKLAASG